MNNFKKVALGLTVASFALGFSAFKSAPVKNTSEFATTYYKLNQAGTIYTRVGTTLPDVNDCTEAETNKCLVGLTNDQGASFNESALPISGNPTVYESDTNGYIP